MKADRVGLDPLFDTFSQLLDVIVSYLPTILYAVAVLASGFVVGLVFKVIVLRIGTGVTALLSRAPAVKGSGHIRLPWSLPVIFANVIFWLTVTFFLATSARILGLSGVADWIASAAGYVPQVMLAALIVLAGYVIATIVRETLDGLGRQPQALGSLLFLLINTTAVLAALRQLGIDLVLVRAVLLIITGAAFFGIAFAFGMGATRSVNNIIAAYYIRRVYRAGQRVRVGALEGEILEITPAAVVLDTAAGRAMVPAMKFDEDVSILLGREESADVT